MRCCVKCVDGGVSVDGKFAQIIDGLITDGVLLHRVGDGSWEGLQTTIKRKSKDSVFDAYETMINGWWDLKAAIARNHKVSVARHLELLVSIGDGTPVSTAKLQLMARFGQVAKYRQFKGLTQLCLELHTQDTSHVHGIIHGIDNMKSDRVLLLLAGFTECLASSGIRMEFNTVTAVFQVSDK